ncbi:hypothetical protein [Sporichthya polymorpha]|uniref:hypothetical protein n=1 Tax=Sporichthya polymorpha TaxID=35751 RepID=UPI0003823E4E|nr:hypothetical protein [Sporichthya polymorpha]
MTETASSALTQSAAEVQEQAEAQAQADRGDRWFISGCVVCGTWVLGPIGVIMLIYGMVQMKKAERRGASIRPWAITWIGGFILVDTSVNFFAWGMDFLWAHDSTLGSSLWIDYGRLVDGGYMYDYNTDRLGGVADNGEKSVQLAMVLMGMPIKMVAAWGFLRLKQWGLQWTLISYWMYFAFWMVYLTNMMQDYPLRFGSSDYGVIGFWLLVNVPFLGPLVLLPYLHTVRRDLWKP